MISWWRCQGGLPKAPAQATLTTQEDRAEFTTRFSAYTALRRFSAPVNPVFLSHPLEVTCSFRMKRRRLRSRGPKDHVRIRILRTMVSGVPFGLGL